jgi:hypothetical protein
MSNTLNGWRLSARAPVEICSATVTRLSAGDVDKGTIPAKARKVTGTPVTGSRSSGKRATVRKRHRRR